MIRLAEYEDIDTILDIYRIARAYMRDNGNPTQWGDGYPSGELLTGDIERRRLYVYMENERIHGVFAFEIGIEPAYARLENGSWKKDGPYGFIHRVASDGSVKGVFGHCVNYCKTQTSHLRIDTHHDNHTMQHLIVKNGFEPCGIIYLEDGSPRLAYQYV